MKVAVLGGGPGGLYFSHLWKMRHPESQVTVFEQNPQDATWGFGVVFSDRALEFLRADDPDTVDAIQPGMETWQDITLYHKGEKIAIDGVGLNATRPTRGAARRRGCSSTWCSPWPAASPAVSSARMARRVGSASAANTRLS